LSVWSCAAFGVHALRVFLVKSATVRDIDDVISRVRRLMKGVPQL